MITIGKLVQDSSSKSFGVIWRECKNSGPNRYEVKITVPRLHHKFGDIVIWEVFP